jgi:hypothetical protein
MDRFNALGRGAQIMLVAGVLLLISTFLNWQEVEFDLGPLGEGEAGVSAWDNFWGVVLGLLTIVLIAWLVVRLLAIEIPLPLSTAMIGAILAGLILLFAVLKNLIDDFSTIWSYIGVLLAIAIAIGAWLEIQAAGGIDTLRSEIPSTSSTTTSTSTATPTPVPPSSPTAPPASEPEAAPPPVEPAPPAEPAEPAEPSYPSEPAAPSYPSEPETPPERDEERRDL